MVFERILLREGIFILQSEWSNCVAPMIEINF
jgi:hypothetical protein